MSKKKQKKKSDIELKTLLVSAIADFIIGLALLLIQKLLE